MFVYAMNRHHPNARVGDYTQSAAYRFYGMVGFVVVVATFYGTSLTAWLITWAVMGAILVPWTIYDLVRIYRETWTETVLEEAKSFDVKKVFTLTYKPDFFKKFGFIQIERSDLPLKIWGDCMICVKFPDCDEIAMMKRL